MEKLDPKPYWHGKANPPHALKEALAMKGLTVAWITALR